MQSHLFRRKFAEFLQVTEFHSEKDFTSLTRVKVLLKNLLYLCLCICVSKALRLIGCRFFLALFSEYACFTHREILVRHPLSVHYALWMRCRDSSSQCRQFSVFLLITTRIWLTKNHQRFLLYHASMYDNIEKLLHDICEFYVGMTELSTHSRYYP